MPLSAEDIARLSTEPEVLADGLRLADHFHQLGLGLRRASVVASVAWLITGIAHEIQNSPELNLDGLDRLGTARGLEIVDVQLEAIEKMGIAGLDSIEEVIGTCEISAPALIGSSREVVDAA